MTQKTRGAKNPTKRRLLTVAAALFLLTALITAPVFAAEEITYIKDPLAKTDAEKIGTLSEYTPVTADITTWTAGYYVVNSNIEISKRITITGDVHLILTDGATLTAKKGIDVYDNDKDPANGSPNSLTIYGQSGGTGKLIATGDEYCAGIGDSGDRFGGWLSGTIIINGGTIEATGGDDAAGIGGTYIGDYAYETLPYCGAITINGGTVHAKGGTDAAGIGGGNGCSVSSITINGGVITATGGHGGAGIGGGEFGNGGNIVINSGIVKATGGYGGAGIGGGMDAGGNVRILSGTVTAIGGDKAAGIGLGASISGNYGTNSFSTGDPSAMQSAEAPFIIANSISDTSGKNQWRGVIFEGTSGKIYEQPIAITTNAEIPNGYTLTIDAGQTLINMAAIIGDGRIQNNGYILNSGYLSVAVKGSGIKADLPNTESSFWTETSTLTNDMEEGYYLLSNDVTLDTTWEPNNDIVLDLSGHVVNLSSTKTGSVITVHDGVTLTLTDSGSTPHSFTEVDGLWVLDDNGAYSVQGGVITGGNTQGKGGGVYIEGGTFIMDAGNIVGNEAGEGGGIRVVSGTVQMNGGSIVGNNATTGGGGISSYAGTVKLNDGSIAQNTAVFGGGVSLTGGITELMGGTIKENTATKDGGGVYIQGGTFTTFTVSKTAKVMDNRNATDNTPNNVYLPIGHTITIADALTDGAMISVTTEAATPVCITEEYSSDMSAFFRADSDDITAFYDAAEKKIYLNETRWYTVFWKNDDGTILWTNKRMYAGEIPEYGGTAPTKAETSEYTYTFRGWDKEITAVINADQIYTATYTAHTKSSGSSSQGSSVWLTEPLTPTPTSTETEQTATVQGGEATFTIEGQTVAVTIPGYEGEVTAKPLGDNFAMPAGAITGIDISLKTSFVLGAGETATVSITASLADVGGDASGAVMMHQQENGNWEELPTTYRVNGDMVTYNGETNSFSPFVLVYKENGAQPAEGQPTQAESPLSVLAVVAGLGCLAVLGRRRE